MYKRLMFPMCLIVLLSFAAQGAEPLGHWTFDGHLDDVAGSADGVFHGGDPAYVAGRVNQAIRFDGVNNYVEVRVPNLSAYTITAWVLPERTIPSNIVVRTSASGPGSQWSHQMRLGSSGSFEHYLYDGSTKSLPGTSPVEADRWYFVAITADSGGSAHLYVDGKEEGDAITIGNLWTGGDRFYFGSSSSGHSAFQGIIDDVRIYEAPLSQAELVGLMESSVPFAFDPQPGDRAVDVSRDVVLSWTAGPYAVTHDVYFGTSRTDVSEADRANPLGVLVSQGQTATTFEVDRLAIGQTYYWRIDEVNAPPDSTIFKGDVWSFTAEPVGYALAGGQITATASSSATDNEGPAKTIDGSGLDAEGGHSTVAREMWLSAAVAAGESAWIQYEFDKAYGLHEMRIWNHNTETEPLVGLGIKEATMEYSLDGDAWTSIGDIHTFHRAPGEVGYVANTAIDLEGIVARYVRITAVSNWGGILGQYGLSEVEFLYIPLHARRPEPASGTTGLVPELSLRWRAGREAAVHEVYLSPDEQAVIDGAASVVTVSEPALDTGMLELGRTYYWRVDEVNEAAAVAVWEGDVWSFSTQEYLVVEDFESYTDDIDAGQAIYQTWIDGWENETGSQIGYLEMPFAERTLVRSGRQSMPLFYDNSDSPFYSETERVFDEPQDWTIYGVRALTLYFRGEIDNDGQLYVKINNTKVIYDGAASDIARMIWQPWSIDLAATGVDLTSVRELAIGVEGADASGVLYIDDIRLYPEVLETTQPVEPDPANLVAYYTFDGDAADHSGNDRHGEAVSDPLFVSGVSGQAIAFDGSDAHVRIAHHDSLNPSEGSFSIVFWSYLEATAGSRGTTSWDLAVAKRDTGSVGYYVGADRGQGSAVQSGYKFMLGNTSAQRVDTPFVPVPLDQWVFVAAVLDRDNNVHKISVDGGHTWATSTPPAGSIEPGMDLGIGWDIGVNNFWFHGKVDELRIYSHALSDEEIAWLAGN